MAAKATPGPWRGAALLSTRPSLGPSPREGSRHAGLAWETSFLGGQDCCLGSKEPAEASAFTLTESHSVNKLPAAPYRRFALQMPGSWEGTTHRGKSLSGKWFQEVRTRNKILSHCSYHSGNPQGLGSCEPGTMNKDHGHLKDQIYFSCKP